MTDQNKRGGAQAIESPTAAAIKIKRKLAALTQTEAATLVCSSLRAWQQWEAGDRRMHPGLWELFLIKTASAPSIDPT